jgi:DNA-directed RNA polymerase subunit RPC12/RpoP
MFCPNCKSADIAVEAEAQKEDWLRCQACGFVWAVTHKPTASLPHLPTSPDQESPANPTPPAPLADVTTPTPHGHSPDNA